VASDHPGYEVKRAVLALLKEMGHRATDMGTDSPESCDYPDYAERVAAAVSAGEADRGVLICGTGIGMSIVANKFPGVRAAVTWDDYTTEVSRSHNDANVLCLGARSLSPRKLLKLIRYWFEVGFEGGRHVPRIEKIHAIEALNFRGEA
jgi:ribose 5-phosphate isomerase B